MRLTRSRSNKRKLIVKEKSIQEIREEREQKIIFYKSMICTNTTIPMPELGSEEFHEPTDLKDLFDDDGKEIIFEYLIHAFRYLTEEEVSKKKAFKDKQLRLIKAKELNKIEKKPNNGDFKSFNYSIVELQKKKVKCMYYKLFIYKYIVCLFNI